METMEGFKPPIWKAKKMFWFDRETSAEERKNSYPLVVRIMIVDGLREDNTAWFVKVEMTGNQGESQPEERLERAFKTLDILNQFGGMEKVIFTEDEFYREVESLRAEYGGTYFDEGSIPDPPLNA